MNPLETVFRLRPGPLSVDQVRDALHGLITDLQWRPERFGTLARCDNVVVGDGVAQMVELYARRGSLLIEGAEMEWFFLPDRPGKRTALGTVSWSWHVGKKPTKNLVDSHLALAAKLATTLRSAYTRACLASDEWNKTKRIVLVDAKSISPNALPGTAKQEVPKVRTIRNGLDALYWRNILGPEFVAMFGDRLRSLPSDVAWDLGEGYWMVQPYATPADAATEQGRARELEIVAHLGPECFYDDAEERSPTCAPDFYEEVDPLPPLMGFENAN